MGGIGLKVKFNLVPNTNALNFFTSHCDPEGRGNLVFARDCFVPRIKYGVPAITGYLLGLYYFLRTDWDREAAISFSLAVIRSCPD